MTVIGIVGTALFVAAVVGVVASLDVLRHKPLATLARGVARRIRLHGFTWRSRMRSSGREWHVYDRVDPEEPSAMDVAIYRDALLRKKGELLGGNAREAAAVDHGEQLRPPGRHGRSGERQQRSPHSAEAETDRRQDSSGDRRGTSPHRATAPTACARTAASRLREARLNAIPWTRSCIACKEKQKA